MDTVVVLDGATAHIPCDIAREPGDRVKLVLWFRNESDTPFYT